MLYHSLVPDGPIELITLHHTKNPLYSCLPCGCIVVLFSSASWLEKGEEVQSVTDHHMFQLVARYPPILGMQWYIMTEQHADTHPG